MKNKKLVWFPVFRRVIPEKFESWLEEMAARGWQLERIGQWDTILMVFKHGEAKRYRFVFDLQANPGRDYQSTYEEFGWELVGRLASAYVWRMEYDGERPEAFSDQASLEERSRRVIAAIGVSVAILFMVSIIMAYPLLFKPGTIPVAEKNQLILAIMFCAIIAAGLGGVMVHIRRYRKQC